MRISDWSSDVCSSDLVVSNESARGIMALTLDGLAIGNGILTVEDEDQALARADRTRGDKGGGAARSEERRVGQECVSTRRSRWSQSHDNKKTENNHANSTQYT